MEKIKFINQYIQRFKKVVVAFSGGVDSSLLLYLTKMNVDNYLAVTFLSYLYSDNEKRLIDSFLKEFNINHRYVDIDPLADIKSLENNPRERCYICKYNLYSRLNEIKVNEGYDIIFDGSNADDRNFIRPGAKATAELGILSPLAECGFTKAEIRTLAKEYNLPMYSKPSLSCYLTRFEYGVKVDKEMIAKVMELEEFIHSLPLPSARCRVHNSIVRIQLDDKDMTVAIDKYRKNIVDKSINLGYKYATLDMAGSYSGSMDI